MESARELSWWAEHPAIRAAVIFAFFVLEKLLLWRHCHTENCEVHDPHDHGRNSTHDHGRSGTLIVVGDTVHNFVDGVLIAAEATLTFLGVGLQPPAISWGLQIAQGQTLLWTAPHLVLFPSIILTLTVMAFIMMGDALRDALDPRQRS